MSSPNTFDKTDALPYDPDQDPEVRRRLRHEYREVQHNAEEQRARPNDFSAGDLNVTLNRANELFEDVVQPQEATLDSRVLVHVSTANATKARLMKAATSAFDTDEFVSKLVAFMGGRKIIDEDISEDSDNDIADDASIPLDWEKIGRRAMAKSRRVPTADFMLGPLSLERKARAPMKRSRLDKDKADQTRPQDLRAEDIHRAENETTKNVIAIISRQGRNGINLFQLVINPNDFAQSVENVFHLSFLIRDGIASLETNESGEPTVYEMETPTIDQREQGISKRQQLVLEFDMATWERAIAVFGITEPKIPQRPPSKPRPGEKWYG
ncbi:hypothetical protein PLICRDRAFT_170895 [Plicaturopsis crispa FD-325 SS-3]|nr:hypothetical protein PLICRDRAFT_170895 [Plicaturopsis crispa FD-325 SS-3]